MAAKFRGKNIFGVTQRQNGPIATRRFMRETLPGTRGYREYQTVGSGPDTRTWAIKGRLTASTLLGLQRAVSDAQEWIGTFGTFEETGGQRWRDCELIDFRQAGDYSGMVGFDAGGYVTVEITATIEQAGG